VDDARIVPDLGFFLLACAGIGVAVALAVVAGTLAARIFFNASRREADKAVEPKHEPIR
jgi:hypothetical protein